MEERNPLEIQTPVTLTENSEQNNKRGRPSLVKAVKFSPQPKSIISKLLNQVQDDNCVTIKDGINTSEVNNDVHNRKTNLENEKYSQIKCDLEPELNSHEGLQESFSFDLAGVGEAHDNFKECYLLLEKEPNTCQSTHGDKKEESATKIFEIACYICPHRSNSQKAHREHLIIHRNQPYKCNFPNCNYICKLSSNLIKHKRIHTLEKPFLCDQCTFRTNFGNSLKVHKRIHTSERPYGCQYCSYQCNSSSNLKKHCLHRHREMS
ncbi:hypothetical protein MSG28_000280 [Choristoneura fumiferana]|uniref:Uncharacterized protein n=2 Tax=Choristoneura fumiferana TaxID=7141 RepID=A0ACC0JZV9_CHOFU|nr:hypothetical protein MSG28_000278 [Choristoneura fumiferana]KAI8429719.1 hypothetical protein MSG28_000280 [Choristoneura fumiferana]